MCETADEFELHEIMSVYRLKLDVCLSVATLGQAMPMLLLKNYHVSVNCLLNYLGEFLAELLQRRDAAIEKYPHLGQVKKSDCPCGHAISCELTLAVAGGLHITACTDMRPLAEEINAHLLGPMLVDELVIYLDGFMRELLLGVHTVMDATREESPPPATVVRVQ